MDNPIDCDKLLISVSSLLSSKKRQPGPHDYEYAIVDVMHIILDQLKEEKGIE